MVYYKQNLFEKKKESADFIWRPYQARNVEKTINWCKVPIYGKMKTGVVVAPVAAGKSILLSATAASIRTPILVLQPNKELLEQNYSKLISMGGQASIYSASVGVKEIGHVTYATLGSVKNKMDVFKRIGVKHVIVDEVDRGYPPRADSVFMKSMNILQPNFVMGWTATPCQLKGSGDSAELKFITKQDPKFFNDIVDVVQVSEMVDKYWCDIQVEEHDFDEKLLKLNKSGTEYTDESVKRAIDSNNVNKVIGKRLNGLLQTRANALIFVDSVRSAHIFADWIKKSLGVGAVVVHGGMKTSVRTEAVEGFKSGKYRVVLNHSALCLDLKTEVLTKQGFIKRDEMTYDHDVANWDKETGKVTWSKPASIIKSFVSSEGTDQMVSLRHTYSSDFRVSGHHDMYTRVKQRDGRVTWKEIKAYEMPARASVTLPVHGVAEVEDHDIVQPSYTEKEKNRAIAANSYNYRKYHGVEHKESRRIAKERLERKWALRYKSPKELTLDECELIGFWLGDGSYHPSQSGGYRYSLSQTLQYSKIVDRIDYLLKSCGIDHSRNTDGNYSVKWNLSNGTGFGEQRCNGVFSLTPYLVKSGTSLYNYLTRGQLMALIRGFWMADGNHGNNIDAKGRKYRISNTNKDLLDSIQQCCVVRGVYSNIGVSSLREHLGKGWKDLHRMSVDPDREHVIVLNKRKLDGGKRIIQEENTEGEEVWCVENKTHSLITRRNGKITILGNCAGFDFPGLECVIFGRPTNSFSLYYQIFGRGVRLHPEGKDLLFIDMCNNVKRFGDIRTIEIEELPGVGWTMLNEGRVLTNCPINIYRDREEHIIRWVAARHKRIKMGFGKHKQTKVWDVPDDYYMWFVRMVHDSLRQGKKVDSFYLKTRDMANDVMNMRRKIKKFQN